MITTLVIAAAGRGTRMKQLAQDKPKHLVEVSGKPFFQYVLMAAHSAGFTRIIVVVGHYATAMREFLNTQPYNIEIIDQYEHVGEKYGTAVVLEAVANSISEQAFVVQNGDSLYTLKTLQHAQQDTGYSTVLGKEHAHPENYGVLQYTADGLLEQIIEKPQNPPSSMINTALYTFQKDIIETIPQVTVSPRGEYEITDAINILARQKRVHVEIMPIDEEWIDLGKPEDVPMVEQFIKKNQIDRL